MNTTTTTNSLNKTAYSERNPTGFEPTGANGHDSATAAEAISIGGHAQRVIEARYARKTESGAVMEDWRAIVERTVTAVAAAETKEQKREEFTAQMRKIMLRREFIPNTPCLVNAGRPGGQLAACFVLPVEDSIDGIMRHAQAVAKIHQTGGGTGQSYEFIRPAGAMVNSTKGVASGPVSFMSIVNTATEVVKQGGVRRGANMGILRISHPDILRFIHAKNDQSSLTNFNLSVTVTDKFMEAVENEKWFQLKFDGKPWDKPIFDPVTGENYQIFNDENGDLLSFCDREDYLARQDEIEVSYQPGGTNAGTEAIGMVYAPDIWNRIIASAHKYAEPGVIFIDEVNRHNYLKNTMGEIHSCNPCVTADTLVFTEQGLKTVRELYESQTDLEVTVDGRFGYKPTFASASKVFRTGRKPVYRLQTTEGYYVRATGNHEIMTSRGWVELKDLQIGEHIHILNRKGGFGTTGGLEAGRVWGWLVGDGHFNESQKQAVLSFYQDEQELAEGFAGYVNRMVCRIGRQQSNYTVTAVAINDQSCRVHSIRLARLADTIGLRTNKLQVPAGIYQGSENMQRGFLQGLFSADGTVADHHLKGRSVRLTSISSELLEGVQRILLNFGIASRIYKNRRGTETGNLMPDGRGGSRFYERQPIHDLHISKSSIFTFADEIGFLQTAKQSKLKKLIEGYRRRVSQEAFVARVESIVLDGEEDVFDLTQPESSSFIANGIVVHNCAEQMLHSNSACNLGSIDVSKFYDAKSTKLNGIDWEKLEETIAWSIRFLDNVIDVCEWPFQAIEAVVKRTRPIGLGIMGFADLCLKLKIRYGSEESLKLMDVLMRFVRRTAWNSSIVLGQEKGAFPEFQGNQALYKEFFYGDEMKPFASVFPLSPRNYEVTTIAPTGTISLVAETSSGIEPNFSWAYVRSDTVGTRTYVHPLAAEALGFVVDYENETSVQAAANYVIENQEKLPDYFVTAMDLTAEEHCRILAAAQHHVDNSISKTCNGRADDTVESVDKLYRLARRLGCKAVSYYRDGSRSGQVLTAMEKSKTAADTSPNENPPAAAPPVPTPAVNHGNIERPRELQGSTWKIDFAENKLYVTVNHDGKTVLEVFVAGLISNGVGVLASTMLQSDCFPTEQVARKLDKITGTNSVWFNERLLTSPEQAVAECLRIALRRIGNLPEGSRAVRELPVNTPGASPVELPSAELVSKGLDFKPCPRCGTAAYVTVAGCATCQECGYSKCS